MITKRFPITPNTLFESRTETIALVYDEHGGQQGHIVDNEGNIVYVNEHHIYEQVEYFNDIDTLNKRQKILENISNKKYTNFIIHHKI